MTTAIIGTGGIGSVIARQLALGGETLRLSSADNEPVSVPQIRVQPHSGDDVHHVGVHGDLDR
jgi:predicted dinucleotide-binding enzyme